MRDFIAFDIETTGLDPENSAIIEVAAVRFIAGKRDDSENGKFVTLVDPGLPIPAEATKINGITDEMVIGKPKIERVLEDFERFCGGSLLVAHNAPFDEKFISYCIKKRSCCAPTGFILDTLAIAKRVLPGRISYRLKSLVDHFKIAATTFHRAEADAYYCAQVYLGLLDIIGNRRKVVELDNLINLSEGKRRFPQISRRSSGQLDLFSTPSSAAI